MQDKKQRLEPDFEQQPGSQLGKEYIKAVYCHPAYLTYMQSTSCKMLASRLAEEISIISHIWWHHVYGRKQRKTTEPLDEGERREWKSWLKTQHSKNKDHDIQSHEFMVNRWGNNGNSKGIKKSLLHWLKPLTVWITTKCGKFLDMGVPDHLTCLLRNMYAGKEVTLKIMHGTMDWFKTG